MRRLALLAFALLSCSGCLRATHPAYTEADTVFDQHFVGSWLNDDGESLVVTRHAQENCYDLTYVSGEKTTALRGVLTKLGDHNVADVTLDDSKLPDDDTYRSFILPLHMFFVVGLEDQSLTLREFDVKAVADYLKSHPDAVKHEFGKDRDQDNRDVMLTADTPELREFLSKMIATEGMLSEASAMKRASEVPATKPG